MCILCVLQKLSRRVRAMLPWLVIPLIGFWALSQLLPPGFRFEVTSPRLACALVLLVVLFWYEVLMPQLSVWRTRRSARLRERRRFEAMELQKLRKTATRRCRNCQTPYRDQNPGGGRFMCSYCGHISKRPVLDIPSPAMMGIANSGIGKIWNGKVWPEHGWICGNDWAENGNWEKNFGGKSNFFGRNGSTFSSGDDSCSAEKSYSGVVVCCCNLLSNFFLSIRWLWRKIFGVSSIRDDGSSDAENKGMSSKKGENGGNYHESRGEKARRKAEEKRQARLEKELLEEEERKQREEVARLVEERRRLRDEQLEAEKEHFKGSTSDRERGNRREAERRRRLEKRKEKDRGSSKSNSDGEDLERKSNRESERKREFDKRSETERRDVQKTTGESVRAPSSDMGHAIKNTMNSFSRVSGGGSRYFDRMKGSLLSSSRAFNGAGIFGRAAHSSTTGNTKVNKPTGFGDHVQFVANRREAEHITGKFTTNGDDKASHMSSHRHVGSDLQPCPSVQKKSWQQLFTCSSTTTTSLDANNTICQHSQSHQSDAQSPPLPNKPPLSYHSDKQMHFGVPLPYSNSPLSTGSMKSSAVSPPAAEPTFPLVGHKNDFISEDAELFEDPCYVPDPVSLLGPVSESLDSFPLDLGTGFMTNTGMDRPHVLKKLFAAAEANRPSPIESPFSRSRAAEERHVNSGQPHSASNSPPVDESGNASEHGTWQMWGTPALGQDGLGGLSGGPANWILPIGQNKSNRAEILHPSQEAMVSQFPTENQVVHGIYSPQKACVDSFHNGGIFSPLGPSSSDNDLWLQKTVFQPLSGDQENPFSPLNSWKDLSQNEVTCDNPSNSAAFHLFEPSPANCWSKRDWAVSGEGERSDGDSSTLSMPHVGLFSNHDVQSLW